MCECFFNFLSSLSEEGKIIGKELYEKNEENLIFKSMKLPKGIYFILFYFLFLT